VVGPHGWQPLGTHSLPTTHVSPGPQSASQLPPHPSESPHAFPAQSGQHSAHVAYHSWQIEPSSVQSTQAEPAWPHDWCDPDSSQCPSAVQQPSGQVVESHS
jgi:hypothetical protein